MTKKCETCGNDFEVGRNAAKGPADRHRVGARDAGHKKISLPRGAHPPPVSSATNGLISAKLT